MRHPFLSHTLCALLGACLSIWLVGANFGVMPAIAAAFSPEISIGFVGTCVLVAAVAYSADMLFVNRNTSYRLLFWAALVASVLWMAGMFSWNNQNPMIGVFVFFAAFALVVMIGINLWRNHPHIFRAGADKLNLNPAAG